MKKQHSIFAVALLLSFLGSAAAQKSIEGHWEGVMTREGAELPMSFDFASAMGALTASFNSPTQRATGIPLKNLDYIAPRVHFELIGDASTIVFNGELNGDVMAGRIQEGAARGTFAVKRVPARRPTFKQEEVSFRNGDVTLSGTILMPVTNGRHPAVVFLHGAGSEGRYAARFLAEYLTGYGIAALIYDKRGVGKSTGDWKLSDFIDLAGDAIAGIHLLQRHREINPKQIGLYGHSQGGMIAPLIASRSNDVAFIISGAGSAVPVYESEINSITNQLKAHGISGNELAEAIQFVKLWVNVMRTGQGWEDYEKAVGKVRGTKWFPILHVPPKDHWMWAFHKRIYDYNAAGFWAQVIVPALVIFGERDLYVPVAQSVLNIDLALAKAKNSDYTILVLPRASHSFNIGSEPGQPFEWWHMAPGFPNLLTAWINQRMR